MRAIDLKRDLGQELLYEFFFNEGYFVIRFALFAPTKTSRCSDSGQSHFQTADSKRSASRESKSYEWLFISSGGEKLLVRHAL